MLKKILYLVIVLSVCACEPGEIAIPKHKIGTSIVASVNLEENYKWQIFYSLSENKIISQNLKTDWDLAFECGSKGKRIKLNSSKAMFVYRSNTSFQDTRDTIGLSQTKKWDSSSGNLDSTAIGDLDSSTYIIDRGYNERGVFQGFKKVQIKSIDNQKYTVKFSNLNGSSEIVLDVFKNDLYNFTFLSLKTATEVHVEPQKKDWDIAFMQYTHTFNDQNPPLPYLVTGCILNSYKTQANYISKISYDSLTLDMVYQQKVIKNIDVIGYDWKTYTGGEFIINSNHIYLILDKNGYYYKLHFIDFYDNIGIKGNPKWEYQQL